MSVNSSSSSNSSLPPLPEFSPSIYLFLFNCYSSTAGVISITTFTAATVLLLLPLCILVLYLGLQRWRQQRLSSSATTSHSDVFTYHMIAFELTGVSGSMLTVCGALAGVLLMAAVGLYLNSFHLNGQMYVHLLTCLERYLAVVHPVTYRNLRKQKGIRIRNVSISCVWLLSFWGTGILFLSNFDSVSILIFCSMTFTLIMVSFLSLSVLCILIRSGPGEGGGARQKLRAFYTMVAILSTLLLKFGGNMATMSLLVFLQLKESHQCAIVFSMIWSGFPSSLVLPLLFLHRAGNLLCWKSGSSAGQ